MSNGTLVELNSRVVMVDLADVAPIVQRGGELRVLITPKRAASRHHIFGQAVLAPGEVIAEHAHDYGEESLYVVRGTGVLLADGEAQQLQPGRAALIPASIAHEVRNTGGETLELIFASAPLAPTAEVGHRDVNGDRPAVPTARCDFVEVAEGVSMFYRSSGLQNTGEPLIFLHGNRDNHSHFVELQGILSTKRQTIAIDLRGHGFSSKVDCPLSADLYADDLDAFIKHHGWESVTLIGHSLGAVTSMVYALRAPERVSRMVLMGAAAYYEMKWKRPAVTEETYPDVIRESNKRAGPFFFLEEYPEVQRRVVASWSSIVFPVHRNLIQLTHPDLRPRIPELMTPTLVIAGEQDRSTPMESARWLSEHMPKAQLAIIPRTGHFMFMEQPEMVASSIQSFLQ